jgi:hypothetical protein
MKLRNVKLAELPETPTDSPKDWKTPSANELHQRFAKLEWKKPAEAGAGPKGKGFRSLPLTRGMIPPVTFAVETSEGQRGILQFRSSMHKGTGYCTASIRYKRLQPAE